MFIIALIQGIIPLTSLSGCTWKRNDSKIRTPLCGKIRSAYQKMIYVFSNSTY